MAGGSGKIIERQKLENGMELVLYDRSRVMAGDRWVVELQCEAYIPIDESYWSMIGHEEPQVLAGIRKMLGSRLIQTFTKQRNFIAAEEREPLLREMVQQVYSGMMEYLKKPNFPMRLFKKQYQEARKKIVIQQAMSRMADD